MSNSASGAVVPPSATHSRHAPREFRGRAQRNPFCKRYLSWVAKAAEAGHGARPKQSCVPMPWPLPQSFGLLLGKEDLGPSLLFRGFSSLENVLPSAFGIGITIAGHRGMDHFHLHLSSRSIWRQLLTDPLVFGNQQVAGGIRPDGLEKRP